MALSLLVGLLKSPTRSKRALIKSPAHGKRAIFADGMPHTRATGERDAAKEPFDRKRALPMAKEPYKEPSLTPALQAEQAKEVAKEPF